MIDSLTQQMIYKFLMIVKDREGLLQHWWCFKFCHWIVRANRTNDPALVHKVCGKMDSEERCMKSRSVTKRSASWKGHKTMTMTIIPLLPEAMIFKMFYATIIKVKSLKKLYCAKEVLQLFNLKKHNVVLFFLQCMCMCLCFLTQNVSLPSERIKLPANVAKINVYREKDFPQLFYLYALFSRFIVMLLSHTDTGWYRTHHDKISW